jgi:tripartite-type tricarboxylate transporter receptor subunit TctC
MLTRRDMVGLLALSVTASSARAQAGYPSGTVKMVVGFAAGGGNDVLARILAERFQEIFKQPFIVDNRPGASGIIAIELVKNAAPDGLTLLVGPSSGMTVNPVLFKSVPYDPIKDFVPIGAAGFFPLIIAINPALPVNSVAELIAYAKQRPGEINYASAASSFQLATEMFAQMAGISLTHIPYKGSAPAITAVLANEVSLTFGDMSIVLPHVKVGKLRALAISTAARSPNLPEIPTVAESGLPGYDMVLWSGLFAPAGTPKDIVDKLSAQLALVVHEPKVKERLAVLGIEPSGLDPVQLTALMKKELERFGKVIDAAKMKIDG